MVRLLITGFEPFGGSGVNPSERLVGRLRDEHLPGAHVTTAILPVVGGIAAGSACQALKDAILRSAAHTVICMGESAKATHIAFERVAVNLRDDRIADNNGVQLRDAPIVAGGPAAYFSTLPLRQMRDACEGEGVPALLSLSAGTFICNEVMYWLLNAAATGEVVGVERAGFVHLPQLPEQAALRGGPSMPIDAMVVGMRQCLLQLIDPLG